MNTQRLLIAWGAAALIAGCRQQPTTRTATAPAMPGMNMGDMADTSGKGRGEVTLSPPQLRELGVTYGTVQRREMARAVRAVGSVATDEARMTTVAPRFAGYAERVIADFTGAPVRRGDVMVEAYAPEVYAAEQELLTAAALAHGGENAVPGVTTPTGDLVSATRQKLALWGVTDAEMDEVLRAGTPRRTVSIVAPATGVVAEKRVVRGQAFAAGDVLYSIADLSAVWVIAEVREADAGALRAGDPAQMEISAFPGRPIEGRVAIVQPNANPTTRTVRVRISVPNRGGRLKPGMSALVRIESRGGSALTAPSSAILHTGERDVVFVDLGQGRLVPREVRVGRTSNEYSEIVNGLAPGDRVVTSAQYLIDAESNLADVMRSMIGQGGGVGHEGRP